MVHPDDPTGPEDGHVWAVRGDSDGRRPYSAAHRLARWRGPDLERRHPSAFAGRAALAGALVVLARVPAIRDAGLMFAGFLDLNQPLFWTVDDALPADLCAEYVQRMRTQRTEVAPIVGAGGTFIELTKRNNTRIMWDDPDEANELLERVRDRVPTQLSGMELVGGNPRLRLYRYGVGEKHSAHWDTIVELADGVRSMLTLVFYLNEGFDGGETDFVELGAVVTPRLGQALLFQHRVMHCACEVRAGEKFVLRTDVLYRPRT